MGQFKARKKKPGKFDNVKMGFRQPQAREAYDALHQVGRLALLRLLEAPQEKMGVIVREVLDRGRPIEMREKLLLAAFEQTADGGRCPMDQREAVFVLLCGPLHGPPLLAWLRDGESGTLDDYLYPQGEKNG